MRNVACDVAIVVRRMMIPSCTSPENRVQRSASDWDSGGAA